MAQNNKCNSELICQFCAITGADAAVGERLLEACGQNLNMAVEMHMDGSTGTAGDSSTTTKSSNSSITRQSSTSSDDVQVCGEEDGIRAPIKPRREVLVQDTSLPTWARLRSRRKGARSVFDAHNQDFGTEIRAQEAVVRGISHSSASTSDISTNSDPLPGTSSMPSTSRVNNDGFVIPNSIPISSATTRKKKTLAELFRPPFEIMFRGTFEQAKEEAKKQGKWLLVDLQNVQEFSCQTLNRDVWNNAAVRKIIKANFLFWQVTCDSDVGSRYQQYYKVYKYPHVSVLNPRTGECLVTWNNMDEQVFTSLVSEFTNNHTHFTGDTNTNNTPRSPQKSVSRGTLSNHILDVSECEQIKAAIAASLLQGREDGGEGQESGSEEGQVESFSSDDDEAPGQQEEQVVVNGLRNVLGPESRHALGEKRKAEDEDSEGSNMPLGLDQAVSQLTVSGRKRVKRQEQEGVPSLPTTDMTDSWRSLITNTGSEIKLLVRYPEGERQELSLTSHTTLNVLHEYCRCHGYSLDDYELVQHFPKKNLSDQNRNMSIEDAGLRNRDTVFIQHR